MPKKKKPNRDARVEVTVKLHRRHIQTLELEKTRLRNQYDIDLTTSELLQCLIENHRTLMRLAASSEEASPIVMALWKERKGEEAA